MDGFYDRRNCESSFGNPSGWAGYTGQDFMPQHAVRAIDYAGMHLWPDNWKRQDLDFGSGWTRNHSSDAAVLAKPLVLEEFGKARGAPPATPCSRPARLTRPCPGMCACQQTGGWHGLGPCRRLFPCPCQRLPAGIVSGVWRHGRGRAPTLACVADGSTWWLVLTRPARAAAGRGRPQRAGPDGAAAAGLVQAHLRAGRGEHQLGRAAQGAAATDTELGEGFVGVSGRSTAGTPLGVARRARPNSLHAGPHAARGALHASGRARPPAACTQGCGPARAGRAARVWRGRASCSGAGTRSTR